jgi:acetoin utilization protein AcuB
MPTKVSAYMTRKVISTSPGTGVRTAFFIMKENSIRHLPVIDEQRQLLGIVSDRELRRPGWVDESHDISHVYYLDDEMQVGDVMIREVHLLHTFDTLDKAVKLLLNNNIGGAPVLDKTGNVVGMLSSVDLLRALRDRIDTEKRTR